MLARNIMSISRFDAIKTQVETSLLVQELAQGTRASKGPEQPHSGQCLQRVVGENNGNLSYRQQSNANRTAAGLLALPGSSSGLSSAIPLPDWQVDSPAWSGQ